MNETTTGAPLTATVGERLGDDPHVREVREEVQRASAEPGAGTREGLTAARGERRGRDARRAGARAGGSAAHPRPFPWGALALGAVGWALLCGLGRRLRRRARRVGEGAAGLARRLPRAQALLASVRERSRFVRPVLSRMGR